MARRAPALGRRDLESLLTQIERLSASLTRGGRTKADSSELERLSLLVRQAIAEEPEDGDDGWDDGDEDGDDEDERQDGEDPRWTPWGEPRFFAPSKPIAVEGGLTAKSRRGAIGETWWSKRFLGAVEPFMAGGRSSRGRSYARRGQVMELKVGAGKVTARVQGSRPNPYKVELALPSVSEEQWEAIVAALAAQAGFAARLLAGEIPHELEDVFSEAGVSLLPSRTARLTTDCSCPDWANPCKHVGAVCYLLAEELDRDPFQLLAWRGRGREELLGRLRELRGGSFEAPADEPQVPRSAVSALSLSECLLGFWKSGPGLAEVRIRPQAAEIPAAVLRQLPRGLIELAGRDLAEVLEPAYADLVAAAERRALAGG